MQFEYGGQSYEFMDQSNKVIPNNLNQIFNQMIGSFPNPEAFGAGIMEQMNRAQPDPDSSNESPTSENRSFDVSISRISII
jgi:hypothetical protein